MPCRPAEHDVRYADGKRAEDRVTEIMAARFRVRDLLFRWCGPFLDDLPAQLRASIDGARREQIAPLPVDPGAAAGNSGVDGYPIGNWGLELMYRVGPELEALCEERTLLTRVAALLDPPDELRADVDAELAAHRAHRREDLDALLAFLREAVENPGRHGGPTSARATLAREHLARAEALTVDDILTDREQLAALWELRPGGYRRS